ncbi:MAG TPA: monovalent cation/H+ antiporter complex subunit F [Clostridia bacterium]|nr:monovalent cation/H+ antiporter complex subunit F [Clostridia bacterium]
MIITTMVVLFIALFISLVRYINGKTIWEKLLSLNLMSIKVLLLTTVYSIYREDLFLLDTSVTFAIVSFLVVVLLARFILEGGRTK